VNKETGNYRYGIYGLLAEFDTPGALVHAAETAHSAGYRIMDCYTPYPLEEAAEAIGFHKNRVALCTLIGGLLGGSGGYSLEYWVSAITYPINVGGKPFHSWPAFIPVLFECTVLGAALATLIGMIVLNGLPEPYHPVFNAPNFARASKDKFFLCIEAKDPKFSLSESRAFLESLHATSVVEVGN
jgi:Protein of unknown function (DUF3341)